MDKNTWVIHGDDLEGHQFNHSITQARQAGYPVTFDDEKNLITIRNVSQGGIEAGVAWIEHMTGKETLTKQR